MVLTAAQTTAFFENPDQMRNPHKTMVQMQHKGIQMVADLADFEKQSLQQLADNLRKPGGRIPDPNPNAAPEATIPMPAFTYGAKSQKRLTVACDLVRFYQTVGRDLTAANIQWNQVMSNFEIQWKALKDRKDEDVPKITKALPIIKWTESFQDFLNRVIGARMIPLAYVIRINLQVPGPAPTLAPNQPHSTEHGSVKGELIARASHTHALFRDDNSVVYYHLEEATRGTSYAASIKLFQKGKDGRGAWKALTSQYAGKDKWEAEIKRQEQLLHTMIRKGQSKFLFETFISQHRNAYVSMQASAEHVQYQLPNEHSWVGFLLEAIQCSDPGLQAAMASIKTDSGPEAMRNNFEATVAHLLPYDPVAKKRSGGQKRGSTQISSVMDPSPTTTKKPSIGKTGVHLHYYKTGEYRNLTNEQKEELKEWRANNPNTFKAGSKKAKKEVPKKSKSSMKKQVASLVEAALNKSVKFDDQVNDEEKYIMSMVQAAVTKTLNQKNDQQSQDKPKVSLKSILKHAKNNGSS